MIVDLNLHSKIVLVVGAGKEGIRKVKGLLGQGCEIIVLDKRINAELLYLERQKQIKIIRQKITDLSFIDNFKNLFIVMAATNDKILNRKIIEKGQRTGALVYAADDPSVSDFSYASLTNIQGIMQIAISTYGKSPLMARKLRIRIERILRNAIKTTDLDNIVLQEYARNLARDKIRSVKQRKEMLYFIMKDKKIQDMILARQLDAAKEAAKTLINSWEEIVNK
jgi:precorrin-2 dehydrogenase/sirohydrochlorin ferrochelatase